MLIAGVNHFRDMAGPVPLGVVDECCGVLFYDPDNLNAITQQRQYVLIEWDPIAMSDMEALASYFDSNGVVKGEKWKTE